MRALWTILVILASWPAHAEPQRTFYGADGRVTARAATDSQGTTTYYDARGRVAARSTARKPR